MATPVCMVQRAPPSTHRYLVSDNDGTPRPRRSRLVAHLDTIAAEVVRVSRRRGARERISRRRHAATTDTNPDDSNRSCTTLKPPRNGRHVESNHHTPNFG